MQWRGRRGSGNIEDRRRNPIAAAGGLGGGALVVVLLVGYFFGVDVSPLLEGSGGAPSTPVEITAADEEVGAFVSVVLADTEEVWTEIFRTQTRQAYSPPVLVLFRGETQSTCGGATAASGPFYCPQDRRVYLDTEFFITLE